MKFEYLEPASLSEACSWLSDYKGEAKIIAGGQSLLPILKTRLISPQYLIDVKCLLELEYVSDEKDGIKMGALTTHRTVETSPLIKERFPILAQIERVLATVQIRNWGTIGGSLCHADPAGDPAPALIALGAKVKATSLRGVREIPLGEFFVDYFETVLQPDEILTEIHVPSLPPCAGVAYSKESVRPGDTAIISMTAVVTLDKGVVGEARIVLGNVSKTPLRAKRAEQALIGKEGTRDVLEEVGRVVAEEIHPSTDMEGSAEYKRELAKVVAKRTVGQAIEQAKYHTLT